MTANDVLDSLTEQCRVDHVGLWQIVSAVQFDLGTTEPTQTRAVTMQLVSSLIRDRGVVVGHPTPDGRYFVAWHLPPEAAVRRIEQEWLALGREPDIGEIAWFTTVP